MTALPPPNTQALSAEITALRSELAFRDQLVEHLTKELQRQEISSQSVTSAIPSASDDLPSQLRQLADLIEGREREFSELLVHLQAQLDQSRQLADQLKQRLERESQLRQQQVTDLTRQREEISAALQQQIEDLTCRLEVLPQLYHQKFSQRLEPVLGQIRQMNQENALLQEKLQTISFVVNNSNRLQGPVDLPTFAVRHTTLDSLVG